MTNYEKFIWLLASVAGVILMVTVLSIGGILTVVSFGLALVVYYPLKALDYLLGKFVKEGK